MTFKVRCTDGHETTKKSPEAWRYGRQCAAPVEYEGALYACGALTTPVDETGCEHKSRRFPNPPPTDGDVCPDCHATYYEPFPHLLTDPKMDEVRTMAEALAVIIEELERRHDKTPPEDDQRYTTRRATDTLRTLYAMQGWQWGK